MDAADPSAPDSAGPPHDRAASAGAPVNDLRRFTRVAIAFHWMIAFAILAQLALGWRMAGMPGGPERFVPFQIHKSIGFTILLLSVARLAWRLMNPPNREPAMPRWQRVGAATVHWGLYAAMIGLPLTGWIIISTSTLHVPTLLFGTVPWPMLPVFDTLTPVWRKGWNLLAGTGHVTLVWLMIGLLALHFGAVVKHQLVERDMVFARMVPGARTGVTEPRLWLAFAVAALAVLVGGGLATSRTSTPGKIVAQSVSKRHTEQPPTARPNAPEALAVAAKPSAPAPVNGPTATLEPIQWIKKSGHLGFATSWSGAPIVGSFGKWTAQISFSPEALAKSKLHVVIDILSASTGDSQQDAALPTSDWFNAEEAPTAMFDSVRIRARGGNRYEAVGVLNLRGRRKTVTIPFTVDISGNLATARGAFSVDRTAFGVGQGEWSAIDQIPAAVSVTFSLTAQAAGAVPTNE